MSKKPLLPLHPVEVFLESPQSLRTIPTCLHHYFFTPTQFPPTYSLLRISDPAAVLGIDSAWRSSAHSRLLGNNTLSWQK